MLNIRQAKPEEYPRMKELWQLSFGDSMSFIDGFFDRVPPESLIVLLDDDVLWSMAAILRHELVSPDGDRWQSGYIYGLATHPDARGRNYAAFLLRYADSWLQRRGCACATLVPASQDLFRFFSRSGYLPAFSVTELEFAPHDLAAGPSGHLSVISPELYSEKRELFLTQTCGFVSSKGIIGELQQWMSQSSGGNLYEITMDQISGFAAAERAPDGTLIVKELLIESYRLLDAVSLLASSMPSQHYLVRCSHAVEGHPPRCYGMLKCYSNNLHKILDCRFFNYFGLGLD